MTRSIRLFKVSSRDHLIYWGQKAWEVGTFATSPWLAFRGHNKNCTPFTILIMKEFVKHLSTTSNSIKHDMTKF